MATDKKLTDLTALTTPADTDVQQILDVSDPTFDPTGTNKKITWANTKAALKTYFDTLYTGGGLPGGSDTQIQYNNAGVFGGATGITWDKTTGVTRFGVASAPLVTSSILMQLSDETGAQSDWGFNIAGGGYPAVNLQSTGGTLAAPTASSSTLYSINGYGYNSTPAQVEYSRIVSNVYNNTAGSETSSFDFYIMGNGSLENIINISPAGVSLMNLNAPSITNGGTIVLASNRYTANTTGDNISSIKSRGTTNTLSFNAHSFLDVYATENWTDTAIGSNLVLSTTPNGTTTPVTALTISNNSNLGIGSITTPTARLHLPAGTATASTAPLKLTSGVNLTTIEDGAIEYDGTHVYASIGTTRYQLDQQATTAPVTSVNGATGIVVLTTADISEVTNLYYTETRVSANTDVTANTAKVGITTTQANDITANNAKVTESTTVTAPLVLTGTDVSIPVATTLVNGYLSSADWNTFNGKQPAGSYATLTGVETLTNKRNTVRTSSTTSLATLTPDLSTDSVYYLTAQAVALTIANPIGTPVIGDVIAIYILDSGTSQTIAYGTEYIAYGSALPTATTISKTLMITMQYTSSSNWAVLTAEQQ